MSSRPRLKGRGFFLDLWLSTSLGASYRYHSSPRLISTSRFDTLAHPRHAYVARQSLSDGVRVDVQKKLSLGCGQSNRGTKVKQQQGLRRAKDDIQVNSMTFRTERCQKAPSQ